MGLTLAPDGTLSGIPTQTGVFANIAVRASNGHEPAMSQTFTITVYLTPQAPSFTSAVPPSEVILAKPYSHAFTTAGYPEATFTIASGTLPPGLQLSSTGLLTGTPTQLGTYPVVVKAANGVSQDATQAFALHVRLATYVPVVVR